MASLDTVPFLGDGVQAFTYQAGLPENGVQTLRYDEPIGPNSEQVFSYNLIGSAPCWEPLTQRLLGYLAAPFKKASTGLLHDLFGTVARELTSCTQSVGVAGSLDARGQGTFTLQVRFEPITAVSSVQRVDSGGNVLETYTVVSYDGRTITVTGVRAPRPGDFLLVSYSYTHEGLEKRIQEALDQLNILTAAGEFLDAWGGWFNVSRLGAGKYGSETYGGGKYGAASLESDSKYSRRIIDRVTQSRNTIPAILAVVKRMTGGSPYIVEWTGSTVHTGFVFRPTGAAAWNGDSNTANHLIWGRTARFVKASISGGGRCTFEVWVPSGSGYSTSQILSVVSQYKASGTRAYVRYYS